MEIPIEIYVVVVTPEKFVPYRFVTTVQDTGFSNVMSEVANLAHEKHPESEMSLIKNRVGFAEMVEKGAVTWDQVIDISYPEVKH